MSYADKVFVNMCQEIMPTDTKILAQVMKLMKSQNISAVQAELLINEAGGDIDLIKRAYEMSKKQAHIENFMGWMRSAIKRNAYADSKPIETAYGSTEAARMNKEAAERLWQKTQKDEIFPQFEQYIMVEFLCRGVVACAEHGIIVGGCRRLDEGIGRYYSVRTRLPILLTG